MWKVYIVKCNDGSLYTGITTDLERRIEEHNGSEKGAKYTRNRQPVKVVYCFDCENRSEASKQELRIKKLTKQKKLELIENS